MKRMNYYKEVKELLDIIRSYDLAEKERSFVIQMQVKIDMYGIAIVISNKQLFWLRDIKDKCIAEEKKKEEDQEFPYCDEPDIFKRRYP